MPLIAVATQQGGAEVSDNGICPTVTAAAGMSGNNQPWICKKEQYLFENHSQDTRYKGPLDVSPIVSATFGMGGNNQPFVVEPIPIHDQATRFSGKHGDRQDGKGNGLGIGEPGDPMNTLTGGDRHAVAYPEAITVHGEHISGTLLSRDYKGAGRWDSLDKVICAPNQNETIVFDKEVYNSGENAGGGHYISEGGPAPTLRGTGHAPGVCDRYIVRRLTPTECARLQGFSDKWGHPDQKGDFTEAEYLFWLEVRNTHAAINGKAVKEYTKEQMLKWYNKLHSDSAEYKMWGNGIALPPALYCMQGISNALEECTSNEG